MRSSFRRRSLTEKAFTDINITPFVDVILVLLIVFMISAPLMQTGIEIDLPSTQAAQLKDPVEPLLISLSKTGEIYIQDTAIQGDELVAKVQAITKHNHEAEIYVRGDQSLSYGTIMSVMGQLSQAGYHKMTLMTDGSNLKGLKQSR